ncbi:MAG: mercuric transporter MerT family protein [Pyrinomonadaceae bacterium]
MKEERLALGGAVAAALAASACCVGPLLFVVLGLGAFGAAAALETARPYLLSAAVLLLAFGFYRTYFRRAEVCAPGAHCSTPVASRISRVSLWVATAAVLAFAFSPYYAGALAGRLMPARQPEVERSPVLQTSPADAAPTRATFKVTGMTCASCETTIRLALERTPGVRSAAVSFVRGEAVVEYEPDTVTPKKLRDAINKTGYKAEFAR